jgi:CRISPR-associated protein Cas1
VDRIVDIETDGRHLAVSRGFLVVSEDRKEIGRVALDDIIAVIVHAHGVTLSSSLVSALAERGTPVVFCGANHAPIAVCQSIEGHHAQAAVIRAQISASRPLTKQLWRRIIVAKIECQAAVLEAHGVTATAFDLLARRVGSGDPENVEAQAARRYWPLLLGPQFRRDRDLPGANALLNYGYAVMRALCARSVVAAGLHPSIGIHHVNRGNAFALADDLVEPFRPLVDALTVRLLTAGSDTLTPAIKRAFTGLIALDIPGPAGVTTVASAAQRAAQSLAACFQNGKSKDLVLPEPPSPMQLAGLANLSA